MSMDRFDKLLSALKIATREHYKKLISENINENYYGYSLYTSDDIASFGPVSNCISAIPCDPTDPTYGYYKYGPHEWSNFNDFGLFDEANRELKFLNDGTLSFDDWRSGALQAALQALRELETEGLFGPRSDERYVVLWLSDSDDQIMNKAAKELNSATVYAAYASEYASQI
jgi:hypothetical protein